MLSKPKVLDALLVALSVNSDEVIVLLLETLNDLSICSCSSWAIDKFLSKAVSKELAGKLSFSIKSKACVCLVYLLKTTVSVERGAVTKVTVPPAASPTPVTA